ncbi:MAG: DNA gyrase subunit A, partial [Candidatus Chloroheliales bacterium]
VARALPDVRDGLKPVHRRILFAMEEAGIRRNTPYRKSARIVGDVMGKYHPHGDAAIYDTVVRMAQPWSLRYMLIDGQGNFGSPDSDPPAAMRYTEARMASIADEILADIDKDTVDFIPNFDGSLKEPTVLPAKLPNLLLNGASGIAVGMATNIPPHNLNELCDGITYLIDNPDATVEDLIKITPGPDFPTGGVILGRSGIQEAYSTGRGRIIVRAKAYIEEIRKDRFAIIITEMPYMATDKDALAAKISELMADGKLDGVALTRNESDRNGIRFVVELKRDAQPRKVLNQLFKYTQLQTTFGANMLALVDGNQPRVLPLKHMLQHYIDWRHEVITRRSKYELKKARDRAHILEGLRIALDNIDAIVDTIRKSRTTETAKSNLRANFKLSEAQAQAILDMRLARLAALERKKIEDEYTEILKNISYLEDLLAHPKKIFSLIKADLKELKEKYGDERRTRIVDDEAGDFNEDDLIPDIKVLVTITDKGYIKRLPHDTYRRQHRGGKGVTGMVTRDMDAVEHLLLCNTLDSLLFFTNKGKVYQLKAHEIPDAGRTAKGLPLINLISIEQGEMVTGVVAVSDFSSAEYLVMATRQGKIKRTTLDEYSAVRSNGIIALVLEPGDELRGVLMTHGHGELMLISRQGQSIRFAEEEVRAMGRVAVGVNGIRLEGKDAVIALCLVRPNADLMVVSEKGIGKRTGLEEFRPQSRAGSGIRAMKVAPKTGLVAAALVVDDDDDLVVISNSGIVIRMFAAAVNHYGRDSQGVQVMSMREGDGIATITRLPAEAEALRSVNADGSEHVEPLAQMTMELGATARRTAKLTPPKDGKSDGKVDGKANGKGK